MLLQETLYHGVLHVTDGPYPAHALLACCADCKAGLLLCAVINRLLQQLPQHGQQCNTVLQLHLQAVGHLTAAATTASGTAVMPASVMLHKAVEL